MADRQLAAEGRVVAILANPIAGPRSCRPLVDRLAHLLAGRGLEAHICTATEPLEAVADQAAAEGRLRAVVAAGGDGTLSRAVNATPAEVPLAIFPLGTANLVARYLGLRPDPEQVCEAICAGPVLPLDAGSANGRLFLLMAGAGFDAEVVQRLHAVRTGHIRYATYVKPILATIRSYGYPDLRIYCEAVAGQPADAPSVKDQRRTAPEGWLCAKWVFIHNLPPYALGLGICPRASGRDGLLDVCTFRRGRLGHALRYLAAVLLGQHERSAECVSFRTRKLRIESDEPVAYQLDGDPGGLLPVEIEVLSERLRILVPPDVASRWC